MKKHLFVSAAFALGLGLVYGFPGKSQAQQVSGPKTAGTFITFDAPGAGTGVNQGTYLAGMNTFGTIAGYYVDANNVYHGFVRDQRGRFITSFDAPGAGAGSFQGTLAVGIDERGVIAGSYIDANNVYHGFVRDADGTVATFDPPSAGLGASPGTAVQTRRDYRILC